MSRGLIAINRDPASEHLFALDRSGARRAVTGSRSALNGYQKGRCFYCFTDIYISGNGRPADVDHFFPHRLKQRGFGLLVDGIWNLVLSCAECNRGAKGKFDKVPALALLERLWRRNEYLISSHHPLRETLLTQTGRSAQERRAFLSNWHDRATTALIHTWEPTEVFPSIWEERW